MTDAIDRRLRAADPLAGRAGSIPSPARLDAIAETVLEGRRRAGPRRRAARVALLVGALVILAPIVFGVAAAILSTEAPHGMGNAATYEAELAAAKAVTPLPPGATWPPYLDGAPDRAASYGVGLGTQMVQYNALCLWLGDWYTAHESGDAPAQAAATDALEGARGWTTLFDPLTTDEATRAGNRGLIDAAVAGDATTVLHGLQLQCTGTWGATR